MGKLIVFEGRDGTGKATQSALLFERLKTNGITCALIDFPQYQTPSGRRITQYLEKKIHPKSPYEVAILYAEDRLAARERLEALLKKNDIVIADRYVPANLAYCTALVEEPKRQNEIFEAVSNLEYNVNRMPREDIVIYFKVSHDAQHKLAFKKGTENDRYVNEPDYLKRVETQYEQYASRYGWRIILTTHKGVLRAKEEIAEEVWGHVSLFLQSHSVRE